MQKSPSAPTAPPPLFIKPQGVLQSLRTQVPFLRGAASGRHKCAREISGGAELFKEMYRLLPTLSFEDYFKNGVWQNDMMRLDIEVIDAHRREAGAPDPPAMEEVDFPPLPGNSQASSLGGLMRALVPGGTPVVVPPGGSPVAALARAATGMQDPSLMGEATAPAEAKAPGFPAVPLAAAVPKMAAPAPLDMKVIALFVSKWKLDPSKAKAALEKLMPSRRRFVMQNFKHVPMNGSSSEKLQEYIAQCEQTGCWDAATEAAAVPDAGGVKRPLEGSDEGPNKRQNTGAITSKSMAASKAAAKSAA
ncbi:unnamed protein product [Effrenium voratum]|nr:unnamed protein product [Effrenium voratum]